MKILGHVSVNLQTVSCELFSFISNFFDLEPNYYLLLKSLPI